MTTMTTIPVAKWFTADDLATLPDDGNRYELLDGELLVSPSPTVRHQRISTELVVLLRLAVPPRLRVLAAPLDVRLAVRRQVQPDVVVVRDTEDDAARIEQVPLLVVEILSAGSRQRDRLTKRRAYEEAGVLSYWLVDPDAPSLTALELRDGGYVEVAHVEGDQAWTAVLPYPVTVAPSALLR